MEEKKKKRVGEEGRAGKKRKRRAGKERRDEEKLREGKDR